MSLFHKINDSMHRKPCLYASLHYDNYSFDFSVLPTWYPDSNLVPVKVQNRIWACRVRSDHVGYCGSLNMKRFVVSSTIIRGRVIEKDGTTNIPDSSNMNAFRETTTVRRLEGNGFQVRELGAIGLRCHFMPPRTSHRGPIFMNNRREKDRRRELSHEVRQGWHGGGVLSQRLYLRRATME